MSDELTDLQIASMISDVRIEQEFTTEIVPGHRETYRLVDFPTVDDLMLQGMRSVAGSIRFRNVEYTSVMDRDAVTLLTRSQLPLVSRS